MKTLLSFFIILQFILNGHAFAQSANIVLKDTTISTITTFSATNSITVGPNFTINSTGNVSFVSGNQVAMIPKITIMENGSFTVIFSNTFPPLAPTANTATNVTDNGFTANWNSVSGATGYQLDVSTSSSFNSFVTGKENYENLDVGNVTSKNVDSLDKGTTYYYRVRAYNTSGTSDYSNTIGGIVVSVEQTTNEIPTTYILSQNHPNPFNPVTTIEFSIPKKSFVVLSVFNSVGTEIEVLVNEHLLPGQYRTQWTPQNIPSGVYFYQLQTTDFSATKKLLLLR